jgi:hypothetical protein
MCPKDSEKHEDGADDTSNTMTTTSPIELSRHPSEKSSEKTLALEINHQDNVQTDDPPTKQATALQKRAKRRIYVTPPVG